MSFRGTCFYYLIRIKSALQLFVPNMQPSLIASMHSNYVKIYQVGEMWIGCRYRHSMAVANIGLIPQETADLCNVMDLSTVDHYELSILQMAGLRLNGRVSKWLCLFLFPPSPYS